MDDLGRGIGYIDEKIVFVPKTIPGDIVDILITKNKKKYMEGKVITYIKKSLDRKNIQCPYFDNCGGCSLLFLKYQDTLKYKCNKLVNYLVKEHLKWNKLEIVKNDEYYNYRNKLTVHIKDGVVGLYEENTHNIVNVLDCLITKESINKVMKEINKWNIKNGNVVIRSNYNEEILISIKTDNLVNINIDSIKKKVKLVGIVLNDKTIYGDNYFYELVNGILYKVSYDAFFQVNLNIAGKILNIINSWIDKSDDVLELYSGTGFLSLGISKKARNVLGIEIIKNAVLNSLHNAKINHISNVNFLLNDVSIAVSKIDYSFNKIVVDPPRSGLSKEVIKLIKDTHVDKIIYVSCNYPTLVRDIKYLEEYEIEEIYLCDMFSFTHHLEVVCLLKRNEKI